MKPTYDAPRDEPWPGGRILARAALFVGGVGVAAVSLAIVREDAGPDPALALPVERPLGGARDILSNEAPSRASGPSLLARAPIDTEPATDVFSVPALPTPLAAARSAARPKPTMPAFAYSYVGRIEEDGVTRLFLARGADLIIVAKGDALGDGFRVDEIGANSVTVTYLPLRKTAHIELDSLAGPRPVAARALPRAPSDEEGDGTADPTTPDAGTAGALTPPPRGPRGRARPGVPTSPDAAQAEPMGRAPPVVPQGAVGTSGSTGMN